MKIFEVLLLNESIVDDLRNSLVKGLLPDHGLGTKTYNNLLKEFEKVASWAKNRLRKGEAEDSAVDNSKVVWLLTWFVLDTKLDLIQQAERGTSNWNYPVLTDKETQKIKNKATQISADAGGRRGIFPDNDVSAFVTSLVHFLGTPSISQKVQGMPLKPDMTPLDALEEWNGMEDECFFGSALF